MFPYEYTLLDLFTAPQVLVALFSIVVLAAPLAWVVVEATEGRWSRRRRATG